MHQYRPSARRTSRPTASFPLLARQFLDAGRPKEAIDLCKRGLGYFPDSVAGYMVLANAYISQGEIERAINVLRDGQRRTGAEQFDHLRAVLAGEVSVAPVNGSGGPDEGRSARLPLDAEEGERSVAAEAPVEEVETEKEENLLSETQEDPADIRSARVENAEEETGMNAESDQHRFPELQPQKAEEVAATAPADAENREIGQAEYVEHGSQTELAERSQTVEPEIADASQGGESLYLPELERSKDVPPMSARPGRPAEPRVTERASEPARHEISKPSAAPAQPLALHAVTNASRLRSSNLRLIPGLEYAPLRAGQFTRSHPIASLIDESVAGQQEERRADRESDFSAFTAELAGIQPQMTSTGMRSPLESWHESLSTTPAKAEPYDEELTPLEQLARKLEHARMPAVEQEESHQKFEPAIVSETFANILVSQGRYAEGLQAFETLLRTKPERREYLLRSIADIRRHLEITENRDNAPDSEQ